MSKNIGGTIKNFALFLVILEVIASLISGIFVCAKLSVIMGIIVIVVGLFFAFLSYLVLFGLGELLEQSNKISENIEKMVVLINKCDGDNQISNLPLSTNNFKDESKKNELFDLVNSLNEIECPVCFHCISINDATCPHCGFKLK